MKTSDWYRFLLSYTDVPFVLKGHCAYSRVVFSAHRLVTPKLRWKVTRYSYNSEYLCARGGEAVRKRGRVMTRVIPVRRIPAVISVVREGES